MQTARRVRVSVRWCVSFLALLALDEVAAQSGASGAATPKVTHTVVTVVYTDEPWVVLGAGLALVPSVALQATAFATTDLDLRGGVIETRWRLLPALSAAPGLLLTQVLNSGGGATERRARFDLTLRGRRNALAVEARTLFEWRRLRSLPAGGPATTVNTSVLRTRLRADLALQGAPRALTPFAVIEPFIDLGEWHRLRTWWTVGFSFVVHDVRFEPHYLWMLEGAAPDRHAVAFTVLSRRR